MKQTLELEQRQWNLAEIFGILYLTGAMYEGYISNCK